MYPPASGVKLICPLFFLLSRHPALDFISVLCPGRYGNSRYACMMYCECVNVKLLGLLNNLPVSRAKATALVRFTYPAVETSWTRKSALAGAGGGGGGGGVVVKYLALLCTAYGLTSVCDKRSFVLSCLSSPRFFRPLWFTP